MSQGTDTLALLMPNSLEGLLIVWGAVLPGALYTWAFEREAAPWGARLSDRLLRFIGASAIFAVLLAAAVHKIYASFLLPRNGLASGRPMPWWFWFIPIGFVALPILLGSVAGISLTKRVQPTANKWWRRTARILVGRDPAPRAWDHLFFGKPCGVVLLELKGGGYVGGLFGARSYASGYPEDRQDLFLESTYSVRDNGSFEMSDGGAYVELGSGLLIRWDEIRALEFMSAR